MRLGRLMGGKPLAFGETKLPASRLCLVAYEAQPQSTQRGYGKAKPFRTSGGKAAQLKRREARPKRRWPSHQKRIEPATTRLTLRRGLIRETKFAGIEVSDATQ